MMRIVAEMMIFANAAVGERIYRTFPRAALLRRHPPPRREGFAEVGGRAGSGAPAWQGTAPVVWAEMAKLGTGRLGCAGWVLCCAVFTLSRRPARRS